MSTITTINNSESWASIRGKINTNFANLNADKIEAGAIANFETTTQLNARDTANRARANHTGTQSADTIIDWVTNKVYTDTEKTKLATISWTNTWDETTSTIKTKLWITTLSWDNTGDETTATIKTKLWITTLSWDNTWDNATNSQYSWLATSKQDTLVSWTNIKTINSTSLLWSGNIVIAWTSPLTTKWDLFTYSTTGDRLPVWTDWQVLTADSSTATWLKYSTIPWWWDMLSTNNLSDLTDFEIARDNLWVLSDEVFTDKKDWSWFVDNNNIVVTYSKTNRTITLTHASWFIDYYWLWVKKQLTSPWTSAEHINNPWTSYYLYSTDWTNFTWSATNWIFSDVQLAFVRWSPWSSEYYAIREVHWLMSWETHEEFHTQVWTYRVSWLEVTAWTYLLNPTDANARNTWNRPWINAWVIKDEDLKTTIPALIEEQLYTTIYFDASQNAVTITIWADIYQQIGNVLKYNPPWLWLVSLANWNFVNIWLFHIPTASDSDSQKYRNIFVCWQVLHTSLASAQSEDPRGINWGNLTGQIPEIVPYACFAMNYDTWISIANVIGRCRISDIRYVTWSKLSLISWSPAVTSHGALNWLLVDDHTQYQRMCWINSYTTNYTFLWIETRNTCNSFDTTSWNLTVTLDPVLFPIWTEINIGKSTADNTLTIDATTWKTINWSQTFVLNSQWEVVTLIVISATLLRTKSDYNPNLENKSNKSITLDTDKTSDIKYPSVKSVYDWVVWLFAPKWSVTTSWLTQNTAKLLGRNTASAWAVEEITLWTWLSFTGTTLNASASSSTSLSDVQISNRIFL